LLLRRWYFAVPLLLLSILGVFLAAQRVGPDYKANGYVQIIPPPSAGRLEDPAAKQRPPNQWMDLGYQALATAALLSVTDQTTLEGMQAKGLSDSVTVTLGERTQLLEIEAVGATPAQASATVQEVIRLIQEEVVALQRPYRVDPQDTITTLVLNNGSGTEVVSSKIKRVLIVAAAAGILMTTALTIAFDSLLRRRAELRLRGKMTGDSLPRPSRAAASRPAGVNGSGASSTRQTRTWSDAVVIPEAARTAASDETQVINIGGGTGLTGPRKSETESVPSIEKAPNGVRQTVDAVEFKQQAETPAQSSRPAEPTPVEAENEGPYAADATIVLPLSGTSWAQRPPKKR
jgi:capsular polysaccharide biosynthesis protein